MKLRYFMLGLTTGVLLVGLLSGSFFLGKRKNSKYTTPSPTSIPREEVSENEEVDEEKNDIDLTKIIADAVVAHDYDLLFEHIDEDVEVRIEGSSCCMVSDKYEAVGELDFIEDASGPWDFDQNARDVKNLKSTYPEHYASSFVGISNDGYLIAFQIENGKVLKISMAEEF